MKALCLCASDSENMNYNETQVLLGAMRVTLLYQSVVVVIGSTAT